MKKLIAASILALALSGCAPNSDNEQQVETGDSFVGEYQELVIPTFATVVNNGTTRRATGNIFVRNQGNRGDRAIEVLPGSIYEPDLPEALPKGHTAEFLLEEVNRAAERPKEIYSVKTSDLEKGKVKIPEENGKLYRYTVTIRDANGDFKDVRFDPLYTSFEDYNMAINVMKPTYRKNETITLMVENWGPNHITYSNDWKVYKKKNDEWEEVVREEEKGPFTDIGYAIIPSAWNMDYLDVDDNSALLIPGNHVRIVLDQFSLKKGQYKLVGNLGSSENNFLLEDEFEVN